jgi:hypothetical protein
LTLGEHLPTREELEREAEEWFFTKYPEERTALMQPMMKQALKFSKKSAVEGYRPLLDYLPRRESPPRCLECRGIDFIRFEDWECWYEHPEGRGRFRIERVGHIDATRYSLYTPEGFRVNRRGYREAAGL